MTIDAPLPALIQDFVRLLADGIENRVYTIAATATKLCPQLDGVGNYLLSEPLEAFARASSMIAAIQSWID